MAEASTSVVERGPLRRCAISGRSLDKARLIRFVPAPDGTIVPDIEACLPGRGLWVGAERHLIEKAQAKGLIDADPELVSRIEGLLARRCRDILGMARRAALAVAGLEKVRALLGAGKAAVVAEASDGGADGAARIARLVAGAMPRPALVSVLDRRELGAALGREDAVHVALRRGRLSTLFVDETLRLAGFRDHGRSSIEAEGQER